MSAPPSTYQANLSRREEMAVSGAAMSKAPWKLAGAAGVMRGADLAAIWPPPALLPPGVATPLSMGIVAFFAVAGAGALVRSRHSRALRWARSRPWRFAVMPGGRSRDRRVRAGRRGRQRISGGAFTAIWHGALAFAPTGWSGRSSGRAATSEPDQAKPDRAGRQALRVRRRPRSVATAAPGGDPVLARAGRRAARAARTRRAASGSAPRPGLPGTRRRGAARVVQQHGDAAVQAADQRLQHRRRDAPGVHSRPQEPHSTGVSPSSRAVRRAGPAQHAVRAAGTASAASPVTSAIRSVALVRSDRVARGPRTVR